MNALCLACFLTSLPPPLLLLLLFLLLLFLLPSLPPSLPPPRFANIVHYLNWIPLPSRHLSLSSLPSPLHSSWWTDAIDLALWEGYSVHDTDVTGGGEGDGDWVANFVLVEKADCPLKLTGDGRMRAADRGLVYASMEMKSGDLRTATRGNLDLPHSSVLDVMAYSSSFWTAGILSSASSYFFLKGAIPTATLAAETVYLNDGGLVDTTGIVSLLQRKTDRVVAFYNNNEPLAKLNSTFANLFGVEEATDSMNSLERAELGQVRVF